MKQTLTGLDGHSPVCSIPMAKRVSDHDWSSTSLGACETWPQSLQTMIDSMLGSGHAMCLMWGAERIFLYNDAYAPILGIRHPAALGMSTAEVWPEVWDDIAPLVERTFAGQTCSFREMPLVMTRNGPEEATWWDFSYSPVRDETGDVAGLLNVTLEATERVRMLRERDAALAALKARQEEQRLLNDELAHRIKNVFSVVQAIAAQMSGQTGDSEALETFEHRLSTLASAHNVLSGRNWSRARLSVLTSTVIATFDVNRFTIAGPEAEIGPRTALVLSLMLHELATNAVKYGALSVPTGKITVTWSLSPSEHGEHFELCWAERGGPPAKEPTRKGFGTHLIRMGLTGSGNVTLDYGPDGLTVRASAPFHLMHDI